MNEYIQIDNKLINSKVILLILIIILLIYLSITIKFTTYYRTYGEIYNDNNNILAIYVSNSTYNKYKNINSITINGKSNQCLINEINDVTINQKDYNQIICELTESIEVSDNIITVDIKTNNYNIYKYIFNDWRNNNE